MSDLETLFRLDHSDLLAMRDDTMRSRSLT
jgi:hypothetical protein